MKIAKEKQSLKIIQLELVRFEIEKGEHEVFIRAKLEDGSTCMIEPLHLKFLSASTIWNDN